MSAGEAKMMQPKLDVEVYCDQKVLMGLGMMARVNQQLHRFRQSNINI